jgi:hypothetical protein
MNSKLGANDNNAQDQSTDKANASHVQGKGLQMNDNSAAGKKRARSKAGQNVADRPNTQDAQGKGLQVNENSAGE